MTIYYPKSCMSLGDINNARVKSFFNSIDPNLRTTIISRKGLFEHIKRSALQAGWMWKECEKEIIQEDPRNWGWVLMQEPLVRYYPLRQES